MNKRISQDSAKHILEIISVHPDNWNVIEQDDYSYRFDHKNNNVNIYVWVADDTGQVFINLINGVNTRELQLIFQNEELMRLPFVSFSYVYDNPGEGRVRESVTFSSKGKITNIDTYIREDGKINKRSEMQMFDIWLSRLAMRKDYILAPMQTFRDTLDYFTQQDNHSVFIARFSNQGEQAHR